MLPVSRTARQRMIELLSGTRLSAYQLAQMLGISERQVEDHLVHVVKTIARAGRAFHSGALHLSGVPFHFSDRRKLTRPSRCPRCRSESITAPRYGIDGSS